MSTPIGESSTSSGSAASEAKPQSAPSDAEAGNRACHSPNELTNTGSSVRSASVQHSPGPTANERHDSTTCSGYSSECSVTSAVRSSFSSATDAADAPATNRLRLTIALATAASVSASDSDALSAYRWFVRAASDR